MADLYYCHACGMRLKPEEVALAVIRGESHATACCEKCGKSGKRVKDPRTAELIAAESPAHVPQEPNHGPLPSLLDSRDGPRPLGPKPTPVNVARITPPGSASPSGRLSRNTPDGVVRPDVARAARNSPAGGVRIDNLRAQRNTPQASARPEPPQSSRAARRGVASSGSTDRRGNERPAKADAGLPLASLLAGAGAVLFLVGIIFATHSSDKPAEAESHLAVSPDRDDKKSDGKKPVLSGADERRMADFERGMPASLGAAPRGNVIFGPQGQNPVVVWKEGKDSLRKPEGKPQYLDGSQKVFFQLSGSAGNVNKDAFVIEYSAANAIDAYVYFDIADFGTRGGMVRFPAGAMQKIEIDPDDDNILKLGKRGNATGRPINGFGLEPKGVQPGTFGVFRISR